MSSDECCVNILRVIGFLFSIFMCYVLIATWVMTMDIYNDQSELEDLIKKVIAGNSTASI